jgi:hypothetical protein
MPKIPIVINHAFVIKSENMLENFAQLSLDETAELRNFESTWASWFAIIATSTYKKDQWKKNISRLFSKPCCNLRRVFEDYAIKGNG